MKVIESYQCEICEGIHKAPKQAERCEAKHHPNAVSARSAGECDECYQGFTMVEKDRSGTVLGYRCEACELWSPA